MPEQICCHYCGKFYSDPDNIGACDDCLEDVEEKEEIE